MCGICGTQFFDHAVGSVTAASLVAMRDTMVYRGPDGADVWMSPDGRVGMAHRRLSIIDLSEKARQPMSNADNSVVISFNGEIYNHAEIRQEPERLGRYTWRTDHSDTEVIEHAYEEWGIDCVHRLRGMFAISIWDDRERSLWLVRDRSGVKPFYYSLHSDRIVFASEIKAILADPRQPREINKRGFYDYLSFLCAPAPDTLCKGIHKVPNGCWLRVDVHGLVREKRYWEKEPCGTHGYVVKDAEKFSLDYFESVERYR